MCVFNVPHVLVTWLLTVHVTQPSGRAFSPGWCCLWGQGSSAGPPASLWPSLCSALTGGQGPSPWWAPGGPKRRPGAWRFRTLRAVCSLFAEVLWPVFWFSYVLESHKLKTGHFPDLIQVTCHFFLHVWPCCSEGHSVSVLLRVSVPSPPGPLPAGRLHRHLEAPPLWALAPGDPPPSPLLPCPCPLCASQRGLPAGRGAWGSPVLLVWPRAGGCAPRCWEAHRAPSAATLPTPESWGLLATPGTSPHSWRGSSLSGLQPPRGAGSGAGVVSFPEGSQFSNEFLSH